MTMMISKTLMCYVALLWRTAAASVPLYSSHHQQRQSHLSSTSTVDRPRWCSDIGCDDATGECQPRFLAMMSQCACEQDDDGPILTCVEPCQVCGQEEDDPCTDCSLDDSIDGEQVCVVRYFQEWWIATGDAMYQQCWTYTHMSPQFVGQTICITTDGNENPTRCKVDAHGASYDCDCQVLDSGCTADGSPSVSFTCTSLDNEVPEVVDPMPDVTGSTCSDDGDQYTMAGSIFNILDQTAFPWLYDHAPDACTMLSAADHEVIDEVLGRSSENAEEGQEPVDPSAAFFTCDDVDYGDDDVECECMDRANVQQGPVVTCQERCQFCSGEERGVCVIHSYQHYYAPISGYVDSAQECFTYTHQLGEYAGTTVCMYTVGRDSCTVSATNYDCSCDVVNNDQCHQFECTSLIGHEPELIDSEPDITGSTCGDDNDPYPMANTIFAVFDRTANPWLYDVTTRVCLDIDLSDKEAVGEALANSSGEDTGRIDVSSLDDRDQGPLVVSTATTADGGSSPNAGAVAGGVVAGATVVLLGAFLLVLYVRRHGGRVRSVDTSTLGVEMKDVQHVM